MKRLIAPPLLLTAVVTRSDLIEFQNGAVADADDMNANFSSPKRLLMAYLSMQTTPLVTSAGSLALNSNTTGNSNTAMGHAASSRTRLAATIRPMEAMLFLNTLGIENTASGAYVLRSNTEGVRIQLTELLRSY